MSDEALQSDLNHPRFKIDPLRPGILWDWRETSDEVKMGLWSACDLMTEVKEFLDSLPEADQIGMN